jgi:hypothetical protein
MLVTTSDILQARLGASKTYRCTRSNQLNMHFIYTRQHADDVVRSGSTQATRIHFHDQTDGCDCAQETEHTQGPAKVRS